MGADVQTFRAAQRVLSCAADRRRVMVRVHHHVGQHMGTGSIKNALCTILVWGFFAMTLDLALGELCNYRHVKGLILCPSRQLAVLQVPPLKGKTSA